MAILFHPNGPPSIVAPKNARSFTLDEMQAHVGGYIEYIYLDDKGVLVVDEESKLKHDSSPNIIASLLSNHTLVGIALYCSALEVGNK